MYIQNMLLFWKVFKKVHTKSSWIWLSERCLRNKEFIVNRSFFYFLLYAVVIFKCARVISTIRSLNQVLRWFPSAGVRCSVRGHRSRSSGKWRACSLSICRHESLESLLHTTWNTQLLPSSRPPPPRPQP